MTPPDAREGLIQRLADIDARYAAPPIMKPTHATEMRALVLDAIAALPAARPVVVSEASRHFDAIMAAIPPESCVHGVLHTRAEACEQCVASDESDPLDVLDFCAGAISDAIGLDEGLDGLAGTAVLAMIRNAKARAALSASAPPAGVTREQVEALRRMSGG